MLGNYLTPRKIQYNLEGIADTNEAIWNGVYGSISHTHTCTHEKRKTKNDKRKWAKGTARLWNFEIWVGDTLEYL